MLGSLFDRIGILCTTIVKLNLSHVSFSFLIKISCVCVPVKYISVFLRLLLRSPPPDCGKGDILTVINSFPKHLVCVV